MGDHYYLQDFLEQSYLVAKGPDTSWNSEAVKLTEEQFEEINDKLNEFDASMKQYLNNKFCEIRAEKKV
mgnify:CR=1 FL=1|jgi:hypothetical protein